MKKIIILIFVFIVSTLNPVSADMFGGTDSVMIAKLSAIYSTLKDYYQSGLKQLAEARAHSEELRKISQFTREAEREYNFVKNFSLERELNSIKDDIDGLSNLDNLDGKGTEEQLRLLRSEIDRRFTCTRDRAEKEKYRRLKEHLKNIERLNSLKMAKLDEAKLHNSEGQSEKTSLSSISSSVATLVALEMAEDQNKLEEDLAAELQKSEYDEIRNQFTDALSEMK